MENAKQSDGLQEGHGRRRMLAFYSIHGRATGAEGFVGATCDMSVRIMDDQEAYTSLLVTS